MSCQNGKTESNMGQISFCDCLLCKNILHFMANMSNKTYCDVDMLAVEHESRSVHCLQKQEVCKGLDSVIIYEG